MTQVLINCVLIALLRICDVSLATTRTILLTKGKSKIASAIGFVEVIIYIKVLGSVVSQLDNNWYLIAYAIGFAAGNYIGTQLEAKLAFGDIQVRAVFEPDHSYIIDNLREKGFGVTVFRGEGMHGEKLLIYITTQRKRANEIYSYFEKEKINAFVSVNDISSYSGGYVMGRVKPNNRV